MLSTTRRRVLATLAATTLAAGLAVAGAAPAQALPGSAVTVNNLTGSFAPNGGGRLLTLNADLTVADPATPGTIVFTIETLACDIALPTTQVTLSNVDHDGIYTFTADVPAAGEVRVGAAMSNGVGGETPMAGLYPFWTVADVPASLSTTLVPDTTTVGTGHLAFSAGAALTVYDLDVYVDGSLVDDLSLGWCDDEDFPYSGLAVGQTIEVRSFITGSTVLASFTIPDLPTQALDDPPAPDDRGAAPAADGDPTLAATGVDAAPYLVIALALLAAGAIALQTSRRRRVGAGS